MPNGPRTEEADSRLVRLDYLERERAENDFLFPSAGSISPHPAIPYSSFFLFDPDSTTSATQPAPLLTG